MQKRPLKTEQVQGQVIHPFGPSILVTSVNDKVLKLLKQSAEASRSLGEEKNVHKRLVATMKHEYELGFDEWDGRYIMDYLVSKMKEYYTKTSINGSAELLSAQLGLLWVNYTYANDFNPMHIHTAELSYIIYVDIPDNIRNEYETEHSQVRGIIEFMNNNSQMQMVPKTGDMFIFPSEVFHTVYPFTEDGCRISVAGNVYNLDVNYG